MICSMCEDQIEEQNARTGDKHTIYEGKIVCRTCYEDNDPIAVVSYRSKDEPQIITKARDDTNGDFTTFFRAVSPPSGYFEAKSDRYTNVNMAHILDGHRSKKMLSRFDDRVQARLDETDIDYARVLARTSNNNVRRYGVYVENGKVLPAAEIVEAAKADVDYNNPAWSRNIFFDDETFNLVAELFPERKIRTDYDVAGLIDEMGESMTTEVDRRIKAKMPVPAGMAFIV